MELKKKKCYVLKRQKFSGIAGGCHIRSYYDTIQFFSAFPRKKKSTSCPGIFFAVYLEMEKKVNNVGIIPEEKISIGDFFFSVFSTLVWFFPHFSLQSVSHRF